MESGRSVGFDLHLTHILSTVSFYILFTGLSNLGYCQDTLLHMLDNRILHMLEKRTETSIV